MPLIYLVAGEASGDALGARLMAALRLRRSDLQFAGIGGPLMAAEGLASLFPIQDLAVMGVLEVLPRLHLLRHRMGHAVADIVARRPDVVVTIDSPGFTLRLLKRIQHLGVRRVHYVAPQVWAWREKRVQHYPGLWDQLLCLLPFEPAFFARHGLPATFVGHPVLESAADRGDADQFRAKHAIAPEARIVTLMPGSRRSEITRLLPIFGATLQELPDIVPVLPIAALVADAVRAGSSAWPRRPVLVSELQDKHDAFAASAAALTKSGTSTLELAMAGVPMVVTYRVNPLTAMIARRLFTVAHVSLVNLLARREVVAELIQQNCTPARLAAAVGHLLRDAAAAAEQRSACAAVLATLRPPQGTPSEAAADAVLALLS